MFISPILLKDGYKVGHKFQYPEGTTLVYSNLTARKSRVEGTEDAVLFWRSVMVFLARVMLFRG